MPPFATPTPPPSRSPARSGGALVLVLVLLLVVAALVYQAQTHQVRVQAEGTRREADAQLTSALFGALRLAMQQLADDADLLVDHPGEDWARDIHWTSPNQVHVRLRIHDAQARFDLNNLSLPEPAGSLRSARDLVSELLIQCGHFHQADSVERLADWIDPDDTGLREALWYQQQNLDRRPGNRLLQHVSELTAVGDDMRDWLSSRPRTTVRGRPFGANFSDHTTAIPLTRRAVLPVNVNSAGREVLVAIAGEANSALADAVLEARSLKPIRAVEPYLSFLPEDLRPVVSRWIDVRSSVFSISAQGFYRGQSLGLQALVLRDASGKVQVLQCLW